MRRVRLRGGALTTASRRGLSGNALKIIGAVSMLLDHVGVILLPSVEILRVLGRLAFPLFAFLIAEGCRHTKHKWRYFGGVFGLAALCQGALYLYERSLEMNVLVTFSISILLIYALQWFSAALQNGRARPWRCVAAALTLLAGFACVLLLDHFVDLDYGAVGCMLPLFAVIPHVAEEKGGDAAHFVSVALFGLGLLLLSLVKGGTQPYSLFALPLLLAYSGVRGKAKLKYFFYVFYPLHLLLLEGISVLCS